MFKLEKLISLWCTKVRRGQGKSSVDSTTKKLHPKKDSPANKLSSKKNFPVNKHQHVLWKKTNDPTLLPTSKRENLRKISGQKCGGVIFHSTYARASLPPLYISPYNNQHYLQYIATNATTNINTLRHVSFVDTQSL